MYRTLKHPSKISDPQIKDYCQGQCGRRMQGSLPLELLTSNRSIQLYSSFIKAINKKERKKGKEKKEKLPSFQRSAKKTHSGSNIGTDHLHRKYPVTLCTWSNCNTLVQVHQCGCIWWFQEGKGESNHEMF